MRKIMAVAVALSLSGCADFVAYQAEQQAGNQELRARLVEAEQDAVVECADKVSCDKVWRTTKAFIQSTSMMKVQFADDTTIFTYNPIDWNYIGMRATRTPGTGDAESIRLVISCKGMASGNPDLEKSVLPGCGPRMLAGYSLFNAALRPVR